MSWASRCLSCDYQSEAVEATCPTCGRRLRTFMQSRLLGWVQVVLGGFLVTFLGGIGVMVARFIADSRRPGSTSTFSGSTTDLVFLYGMLGIAAGIGLASMAGGRLMLRDGRVPRAIVYIVAGLALALLALALSYGFS